MDDFHIFIVASATQLLVLVSKHEVFGSN